MTELLKQAKPILFIGSGTTAIAVIKNGRRFIGFENNEKLYRIACGRSGIDANGQMRLFLR